MHHQRTGPLASVVVPCRGHARELRTCLRALQQQVAPFPYEIIIVDSAASEDVAQVVAAFPMVHSVRSQSNLLPGSARNLGVQHAQGQYLAFTDADCIPEPSWLAAAIAALESGAKMVGGPVLDVYPYHVIAASDNLLQFTDFSPHRPEGEGSYLPGCNLAVRQTTFQALGGFSTTLPAGEDTLFSEAAAKRWPGCLRFVPDMQIRHSGRTGLRAFWHHQEAFGFYRGRLGLRLQPVYQHLGKHIVGAILIAYKRLAYFAFRMLQWHPIGLLRLLLLLPLLLVGLTAWGTGFHKGCCPATGETP